MTPHGKLRLFYAPASPYSAKARMAAAHLGLELDAAVVDTNDAPAELLAANPLGKIPVLLDGERAVFDSRVILRHLDRLAGGGRLFPAEPETATAVERLEALADGICDCLLAHVYERRLRPAEKVHAPWLERQWNKAERGLDALGQTLPALDRDLDAGAIALRAALGYLALRFAGEWENGRGALLAWAENFDRRFPALVPFLPR